MSLLSTNHAFQLITRILDPTEATEPVVEFAAQKPAIPLGRSGQPLPEDLPENQGVSSRHIAAFLEALDADPNLRMHSVLILRHGKILCRAAFGAQRTDLPKYTFSACKSVTSLAVGLVMDDGLLHPEDKVADFFPEECGPVSRRLLKDLTVEHLLTMTATPLFNEASSMTCTDWVKGYLSSPGVGEQGKRFQYNSLNTYMLSAIVCRLTGETLSDFLTRRLFEPMGIADFYWETCPAGIEKGGWGLYMRPEDLAKLAILVQNGGIWNGQRLLSEDYLQKATQTWAVAPESYGDFNYGWQIWVGRRDNTFLFNGMLGQNVLCYRDSDIVLVSHAGNDENFQQSRYFSLAKEFFGGEFPDSLPRDGAAERALRKTLQALCACPGRVPDREEFEAFNGKRFAAEDPCAASAGLLPLLLQAVENSYSHGLQAIAVGGTREKPELFYEERDQLHHITSGTREPLIQTLTFHGNLYLVATQARFTHDDEENPVLRVRLDFLETPCTRVLKLVLTPHGPVVRQQEFPGADYVRNLADQATTSAPAMRPILSALLGSSDPDFLGWKLDRIFAPSLKFREDE